LPNAKFNSQRSVLTAR